MTRWMEDSMAKKASPEPMECQPAHYGNATPMAPAPTTRPQNTRAMATAFSEARAEMVRQRSLTKQRAQIQAGRSKDMPVETWTPELDQRLLEMKSAGAQVALIAKVLNRTEAATTGRLITLRKRNGAI